MTWSRLSRCRSSFNPFSSGQVFRQNNQRNIPRRNNVSIPLEQGGVFRLIHANYKDAFMRLNPFRTGRVFRRVPRPLKGEVVGVSIPLERGRVFRHMTNYMNILNLLVSIPLEQGRVFRHVIKNALGFNNNSFNPFGTGRGLSTCQFGA